MRNRVPVDKVLIWQPAGTSLLLEDILGQDVANTHRNKSWPCFSGTAINLSKPIAHLSCTTPVRLHVMGWTYNTRPTLNKRSISVLWKYATIVWKQAFKLRHTDFKWYGTISLLLYVFLGSKMTLNYILFIHLNAMKCVR